MKCNSCEKEILDNSQLVFCTECSGYENHVEKKVKIILHEYAYHCGDGCCFNYGTITTVNDTQLDYHNQDAETIVRQILEHLGYSVEIETTYDDGD
ncbi:MAG: hypothetical protein PHP53_11930 [Prolixibacteraceae bacterium]|nr:hypothetical protein [Prolixibacteraceae bacterium]